MLKTHTHLWCQSGNSWLRSLAHFTSISVCVCVCFEILMLLTFPWAGNGSTVGTWLPSLSYIYHINPRTQFGLLKQNANSTKAWVRFEYDDFLWRWWQHLCHTGFAAIHLGAWSFVLTAIRVVLQCTCPLSNKQTWHWTRNQSVNLVTVESLEEGNCGCKVEVTLRMKLWTGKPGRQPGELMRCTNGVP